jgi:hypothetical protein
MISVCVQCGTVSIFNADLSLRAPNDEEERLIISLHPEVIALQLAIRSQP